MQAREVRPCRGCGCRLGPRTLRAGETDVKTGPPFTQGEGNTIPCGTKIRETKSKTLGWMYRARKKGIESGGMRKRRRNWKQTMVCLRCAGGSFPETMIALQCSEKIMVRVNQALTRGLRSVGKRRSEPRLGDGHEGSLETSQS